MDDPMQNLDLDPQDAARWEELAVLLGVLGAPAASTRFATLYRREVDDPDAEEALARLLDAAATLWAREHDGQPTHPLSRVA